MADHARRVRNLPSGWSRRTHPRRRTRTTFALALSLILTLLAALAAHPAHAQPSPAEIEAEIDAAWRELEPIIEEHNAIRIELADRKKEAEQLAEKIEPLQLKVDLAQAEVADLVVYSYKTGNVSALSALLTTGSPLTFVDRLAVLDQFARVQRDEISGVLETKEEYETEKAELDGLVAELTQVEEELARRADEIDQEIERLQELRVEAYGSSGRGTGELAPVACPTSYPGGAAGAAIAFACAQIGKPYVWGTSGPNSYDCSGLTSAAWADAGVSLPHNAAAQRNAVRYVNRSELRPGDLVFYYSGISHVGIYAGDGWIVHAPQAGDVVHMAPIDRSPIHSYGRPG